MDSGDRSRLIDADCQDGEINHDIETAAGRSLNGNQQQDVKFSGNQAEDCIQPSNEEPVKYTSQLAALLITINVTVGAGLLAMPYAMQASGLVMSIIVQLIFLVFVVVTCIMCTELTVKTGTNSYHRVVQAHCHPFVFQLTQVAILLIIFGTTVAFIVIIGDQSDRVFSSLYGSTFCYQWYMNRRFIMSAVTVFILKPLCSAKTVDFLKYASFAGVLSLAFVIYVVISQFIKVGPIAADVDYLPKSWLDIGGVMPVFCLAYQCHLSWVPIAATVRKEEKYTTYKTVTLAMIITTIIYSAVCILAVLTYGSKILSDLTENFQGNDWLVIATIAIVAFKCVVTLPPAFLPARLSIVDILSKNSEWFSSLSEPKKRIGVTYVTMILALLLALFVPDILVAVDVLGCLAVMFIFTLPGLCYLNQTKENRLIKQQLAGLDGEMPIYSTKDRMKRALSYFLIVFGFLMTGSVLYSSVQKILSSTPSAPICHS